MADQPTRQQLYDQLRQKNFLTVDFNTFSRGLDDSSTRQQLYNKLVGLNYLNDTNVPFETFDQQLRPTEVKKKEEPSILGNISNLAASKAFGKTFKETITSPFESLLGLIPPVTPEAAMLPKIGRFLDIPNRTVVGGVAEATKDVASGVQDIQKGKTTAGALKIATGVVKAPLSIVVGTTPAGIAFSSGGEALQQVAPKLSELVDKSLTPFSSSVAAVDATYKSVSKPPVSDEVKSGAGLADVVFQFLLFKFGAKVAKDVSSSLFAGKPLTLEQKKIVQNNVPKEELQKSLSAIPQEVIDQNPNLKDIIPEKTVIQQSESIPPSYRKEMIQKLGGKETMTKHGRVGRLSDDHLIQAYRDAGLDRPAPLSEAPISQGGSLEIQGEANKAQIEKFTPEQKRVLETGRANKFTLQQLKEQRVRVAVPKEPPVNIEEIQPAFQKPDGTILTGTAHSLIGNVNPDVDVSGYAARGRFISNVDASRAGGVENAFNSLQSTIIPYGKEIAEDIQTASKATSGFFGKQINALKKPSKNVQEALDSMYEHHSAIRDASFVAKRIEDTFVREAKNSGIEQGRWMNLIHALQQPDKYLPLLAPNEVKTYDWLKSERDKISKYAVESGVIDEGALAKNPNYLFQWWVDEKTGKPYSPMYGQFSKGAPQLRKKFYSSYEEGIAQGKTPATNDPAKLIGLSLEAVTRAAETRNMFKSLAQIEAEKPDKMYRSQRSSEEKPLRIIESWSRLSQQGKTEGYVRYDHPALDKTMAFKTQDGKTVLFRGPIGVREELYPFVHAYFESPTYGNLSKAQFAIKTLKLMSGFHVISLEMQALAGGIGTSRIPGYNVVKGLSERALGGEDLRLLNKHGLEVNVYPDIGQFGEKAPTKGIVGKAFRAASDFTFKIVHPGVKTAVALDVFRDLRSKMENRLGRPLNQMELDEVAKETVKNADRLFSGEDYRAALLQSNEWMAKYYFSPEARKFWQSTLLSPTWQKEHLAMAKEVAKAFTTGAKKPEAYLYRKYFYSALALYGASNMLNWVTSKYMDNQGRFMFQNQNPFSIRLPWNNPDGSKSYVKPLKSIFEVAEFLTDPLMRFIDKLAPWYQAGAKALVDLKEGIKSKGEVLRGLGQDILLPMAGTRIIDPTSSFGAKILSLVGMPTSSGLTPGKEERELQKQRHEESFEKDDFIDKIRNKELKKEDLQKAIQMGWLKDGKFDKSILEEMQYTKKQRQFRRLPLPNAIKVFKEMTKEEKKRYAKILFDKMSALKQNTVIQPQQ